MNDDFLFFVFFLVIFILGILIRIYYGRKSPDLTRSRKERMQKALEHEGRFGFSLLMVQAVVMVLGILIYLIYASFIPWLQFPLPEPIRWVGVVMGLISIPFQWWVQHSLGQAFSPSLTIQDRHQLVTIGPYRWVRHPMYTVHVFYFLSWFLVSANLLFLVSWILMLIHMAIRIPKEECMLLNQFGDDYRAYMERTGPLFPRLRRPRGEKDEPSMDR